MYVNKNAWKAKIARCKKHKITLAIDQKVKNIKYIHSHVSY